MKIPVKNKPKQTGPKILVLDIETAPIVAYTWGTFDQDIPNNMIKQDWHLLSYSAKWVGDNPKKIIYADQRREKDVTNDKKLLEGLWKLIDEADIIVGQNSNKFDLKKINARFIMHGMQPPSSYKKIDTLVLAKKHFAFTSNKLEFLSDKLNDKYKKLDHAKYPGFAMWKACLAGDKNAWEEMKKYNCHDVLATEELYQKLVAWEKDLNFNAYHDELNHTCVCGGREFRNKGYAYTMTGRFNRYKCLKCGKETRGKENLLTKEKRRSLRPS